MLFWLRHLCRVLNGWGLFCPRLCGGAIQAHLKAGKEEFDSFEEDDDFSDPDEEPAPFSQYEMTQMQEEAGADSNTRPMCQ